MSKANDVEDVKCVFVDARVTGQVGDLRQADYLVPGESVMRIDPELYPLATQIRVGHPVWERCRNRESY